MSKHTFDLNGTKLEFITSPGVFAQYGLDVGSEILLNEIVEHWSPSRKDGALADSYPGSGDDDKDIIVNSDGIPHQVRDDGSVLRDDGSGVRDDGSVLRDDAIPKRILDLGCGCGFLGLSLVGYFGGKSPSSRKDGAKADSYPGSGGDKGAVSVNSDGIPHQVRDDGKGVWDDGKGVWDDGSGVRDTGGVVQDDTTSTTALLMDSDIRAVRLSRKNAKLNKLNTRVEIEIGDAATDVPKGQFDLVVSNPPTHQGREVVMDFIRSAHHGLREGGEAWFVVNRMASMIKKVDEVFGNSEKVGKKKGYIVVRAVK